MTLFYAWRALSLVFGQRVSLMKSRAKKMTVLRRFLMCVSFLLTFTTATAVECPRMCDCRRAFNHNQLVVDCGRRQINATIFRRQLDLFLTDEDIRERLTRLNITNTPLTQVPTSVCQLRNLTSLYLDHNRLTRLPDNCLVNLTSLQTLSTTYNRIIELQDGIFDGLNSLTDIDFKSNRIASIGLRVFSNPNDLVSIKRITLDNNRLTSIDIWPYVRGLYGQSLSRVLISIRNNFISSFTNKIRWQWDCSTRSYARLFITGNAIRHLNDIPVGWNVTSTGKFLCFLHSFRIYLSESTDYQCDCHDIRFYRYQLLFSDKNFLQGLRCSGPLRLFNELAVQVPLEEFVCELSDGCPVGCRCVYRPANATLHVNCAASNLSSLSHSLPPLPRTYDMYKLDFSNNKLLRRLELRPYIVNTTILDVSNCAISYVDIAVWRQLATMKSFATSMTPRVYLQKNDIQTLPVDIRHINFTSTRFTLHDNPWKCSCQNRWMIALFKSSSTNFQTDGNVVCALPSRLKDRILAQSNEDDFCVDPQRRMLIIFLSSTLSVVAVVAVLLVSGFLVHRMRVRLYRSWNLHPFDVDECVGEDMDYDVFLCCSSEDHSPHGLRILELMECKGYRVCYHLRDFLPGELISDNMIQAIERSKRTVCFVSSNFLKR